MEEKFVLAWRGACESAQSLGVRMKRTLTALDVEPMKAAHRALGGSRASDGFEELARLGRLDLSLEALAVRGQFGSLFTDEEVNTALARLLEAGYNFKFI
ncbi:MAG: hypothetical protein ACI3VZ_06420 [Faecousia sp.]